MRQARDDDDDDDADADADGDDDGDGVVMMQVMREFREGGYNTLVSTCIGEEGLDIGCVDLIICFDAHKSPVRLIQRMGRTGRKRQGRIVMLVTEGKEEQVWWSLVFSVCIFGVFL